MQDRFKIRGWNGSGYRYDLQDAEAPLVEFANGWMYELEQCTGLKDKNGKLIYEGDIVRTSYLCCKNYEVKWGDCCWELRKEKGFIVLYEKISEALEVIGNIHENPDLLENNDE